MGLGYGFEFSVVVFPAPAYLLNSVLPAVEVDHFMEHGVQGLLNRVIQHFSGDVQLIRAAVLALPHLGRGTVSVGPRLALDGDNWRGQFPGEEVCI